MSDRVSKSYRTHSGNVAKIKKFTYPKNWKELCKEKKKECGNKCQRCESQNVLEVHHIIPLSRGGNNSNLNLIVLCHACHTARHRKNKFFN